MAPFWFGLVGFCSVAQCVKVAGKSSRLRDITSGVPQGSVLCELVFTFIFALCLTCVCIWKYFADGFKLYLSFPRSVCVLIFQGLMRFQNDLDKVCYVARLCNLNFNIGTCVVMRFRTRHATHSVALNYNSESKIL